MTDDENRDESEDELRRRAEESFNTGVEAYEHGDSRCALERFKLALTLLDQYTPEADRIEAGRTGARCVLGIGACLINLDEAVFPDHFTRAQIGRAHV